MYRGEWQLVICVNLVSRRTEALELAKVGNLKAAKLLSERLSQLTEFALLERSGPVYYPFYSIVKLDVLAVFDK